MSARRRVVAWDDLLRPEIYEFDLLTTRQLRAGMILCESDGFAGAVLEERLGVRQGVVVWIASDYDTGKPMNLDWPASRVPTIKVARGILVEAAP